MLIALAICHATAPEGAIVEFMTGLFKGLHVKESADEIEECLNNHQVEFDALLTKLHAAAVQMLKRDAEELKKGLSMFISALQEFFKVISPCVAANSIIKVLITSLEKISISKVIQKIFNNVVSYIMLVSTLIGCISKDNWECQGDMVGRILTEFVL